MPEPDQLLRAMSNDGTLRAVVANTSQLAAQICHCQRTDPTATVALGRLISGVALMGSLLKGSQRLAVSIEGNGPLQKLQAESDAAGNLRATIKVPVCNLPPVDGRFDVAHAIGKAGFLHVVKDLGLKEPYRGMVQLTTSEIAEDLSHYFYTSEQLPTAIILGVTLDSHAEVAASGGLLIQAMPGCDEAVLEQLEQNISTLPPISTQLANNATLLDILQRAMTVVPFTVQATRTLQFDCNCNKTFVLSMLRQFPHAELLSLLHRPEETEVTCEYCKRIYTISKDELQELIAATK